MRVGGVVLCGGRSSRMGTPKAWLPVDGEPMLVRVVRAVGGAARPVVVVTAAGQDVPPLPPGVRLVRDEVEGQGPLAGLVAGLTALDGEADVAFVAGCDLPFLSAAFVRRMVDMSDGAVCVPEAGGRVHPLAGVYAVSVLPVARAHLLAGRLRMTDLLAAVPTRFVTDAELGGDAAAVRNVNTPDEYAAIGRTMPP